MAERARRMTPRRLSFNLDDFPETDGERIDLNTVIGNERLNDGPSGGHFITPTVNPVGGHEELNLLSGFETPEVTVTKNDTQAVIPVDILNNLIASQQSLVNLVTGLKAQTKEGETIPEGQRVHRSNKELRLKEFSKSLSGRAFTWYVKLRPRSINTWEELAAEFCGKFLEEEGAFHIMDLGRVKQKAGEGLLAFIKRYRDRALQCKETLPEADLVYGCIKNIQDGSHIFLSLWGISTFAELIKKGTDVAEAMKRRNKRTKEAESAYDILHPGRKKEKLQRQPVSKKVYPTRCRRSSLSAY
ncbi:Retrotransposon gag domain [Sesbania bispinosa]|nr:Retrotransposon gag domain [Sesbania bispinosa]